MANEPYPTGPRSVKPKPPDPRDETGVKFWRDKQRAELRRSMGIFTTDEVLDALQCSRETLSELRREHGLAQLGTGKQRFYERDTVIASLRAAAEAEDRRKARDDRRTAGEPDGREGTDGEA